MRIIFLIMIGLSISANADFSRKGGVVTDSRTLLQWQDDYSDNQGNIKVSTWIDAIEYCESLNLDSGGWRLSNKRELLSIIDYTRYEPSINPIFLNTYNYSNWTSTTLSANTSNAFVVKSNGETIWSDKSDTSSVRCVR